MELNKKDLQVIRFALKSDLDAITKDFEEWTEDEIQDVKIVLDKIEHLLEK